MLENAFVQLFGFTFLLTLTLIMLWICMKVLMAMAGEFKLWRENLHNHYLDRKSAQIDKKSRVQLIKKTLIDNETADAREKTIRRGKEASGS